MVEQRIHKPRVGGSSPSPATSTKEELSLFKRHKIKKILEVCCGNGRNLILLSQLGYEVRPNAKINIGLGRS